MSYGVNLYLAGRIGWARTICKELGLTLVSDEKVEVPCVDSMSGIVYMPPIKPDWKNNSIEINAWCGALFHELCHKLHPLDLRLILRLAINMKSAAGIVFNVVVDHNVERQEYGNYCGRDYYLESLYKHAVKGYNALDVNDSMINEYWYKHRALQYIGCKSREMWMRGIKKDELSLPIDGCDKWIDKLVNNDILEEFFEIRGDGIPNWVFTKRICEVLEIEDPELDKDPNKDYSQEGDGEGNGEGNETQEGQDQGDQESDSGEGAEGTDGGSDGDRTAGVANTKVQEVDIEDMSKILGDNTPLMQAQHSAAKHIKINYNNKYGSDNYQLSDPNIIEPIHNRTYDRSFNHYVNQISQSKLPKRIRNELKVLTQAKIQRNKTKGKINRKAIGRIATRTTDRPFQKLVTTDILDTCIMLLIDNSGSMCGRPFSHASAAAWMMVECFQAIQVPTSVITFSAWETRGSDDVADFTTHKEFNHKITKEEMLNSLSFATSRMGVNPDGEAILYGIDKLIPRKEKRKLIFVLSDGSPNFTNHTGDIDSFTQRVVKEIESRNNLEIYGIGLMDDNVERIYKNNIVINQASELEHSLLNLIKNAVLKN